MFIELDNINYDGLEEDLTPYYNGLDYYIENNKYFTAIDVFIAIAKKRKIAYIEIAKKIRTLNIDMELIIEQAILAGKLLETLANIEEYTRLSRAVPKGYKMISEVSSASNNDLITLGYQIRPHKDSMCNYILTEKGKEFGLYRYYKPNSIHIVWKEEFLKEIRNTLISNEATMRLEWNEATQQNSFVSKSKYNSDIPW
jgi:hypothetical protein